MNERRATLMRIFLDEEDRAGARPLYMTVVDELRDAGFAGATVLKGIEGYGARRQLHSFRSFDFSTNLPILIEVVESEERVMATIPRLRELIAEGLITLETIHAV